MNTIHLRAAAGFLLAALFAHADSPSTIHYQGRLALGTNLYSGPVNVAFRLYNAPAGGTLLHHSTNAATAVDGLYATAIGQHVVSGNIDAALTNQQVWLEVSVNGSTLSPRERLMGVPYARAIHGMRVISGNNIALNSEEGLQRIDEAGFAVIGGGNSHFISNAWFSTIGGGSLNKIFLFSDFSTIGGGVANVILTNVSSGTISGGRENALYSGAEGAAIGGGQYNSIRPNARSATIAGGDGNIIFGSASNAAIGGGQYNVIYSDAASATIAGGYLNRAWAPYAAIGGGRENTVDIEATNATISGGSENLIDDGSIGATIGGGSFHLIQSGAPYVTIGGGAGNLIESASDSATIAGGSANRIDFGSPFASICGGVLCRIFNDAPHAMISGGRDNRVTAGATNAWVAGRRAVAQHRGAFLWADNTDADLLSTDVNQTTFRSSGGFRIFSNPGMTLGVVLNPSAAAWAAISDRNAKENIEPIDPQSVLDEIKSLPLSRWSYKADPEGRRYIGPMAQDFHSAFGLGDDRTINTLDADGVLFAAVQALARENEEIKRENETLREELQTIKRALGL